MTIEGWTDQKFSHLRDVEIRCLVKWFKITPDDVMGPPVGLIVGEMPSPESSPRMPLFPYPASSSGGRLLTYSKLTPGQFLGRLRRTNLFCEYRKWDRVRAAELASQIIQQVPPKTRVVLCGRRVCTAFKLPYFTLIAQDSVEYVGIPHPSGLNREYNRQDVRDAAGSTVSWAANIVTTVFDNWRS